MEYHYYFKIEKLFLGAVQFAQLIRSLEKEDAEVAKLHSQVRSYYLPVTDTSSWIYCYIFNKKKNL